jgi:hypothetical protein
VGVAWTKDLDGRRSTREALWYAFSVDSGRTWSRPTEIAKGGHIKRAKLLSVLDRHMLVYSISKQPGSGATLYVSWLDRNEQSRHKRLLMRNDINDFDLVNLADRILIAFSTLVAATPERHNNGRAGRVTTHAGVGRGRRPRGRVAIGLGTCSATAK